MSPTSSSEAIASVAEKYKRRGYVVTFDPPPDLLPVDVRSYRPDFVAIRDDEKVAVEVKTRRALGADPMLMRLAEKFRVVPGWRLDVAVVEESGEKPATVLLSDAEIRDRLDTADRFAAQTKDYDAALLLVWTGIEAVLHAHLENDRDDRPVTPNRLAKMAYSLGIVDEEQLPIIEWLVRVRNEVVHGRKHLGISAADYARARELADHIVGHRPDLHDGA